jgi:4-amino-4-deoxy-L-arabinose transferase-like glycosyltransferase
MDSLDIRRRPALQWLLALIIVGLLLRAGLWLRASQHPQALIQGDGVGYELLARNLLEGHGFSMDPQPPYTLDMLRTPGYPAFIAGLYAVAGYRPEIVTLVQNLLSLFSLVVAYQLGLKMFGRREALVAAALITWDVGTVILANVTLTETVFMTVFVPAIYCFYAALGSPHSRAWLAGSGLLLGLSTLVRPAAMFLPLVLLPVAWWALLGGWKAKTTRLAILCVAYLAAVSPWVYRNYETFGSADISLAPGYTLNIYASYLRSGLNHTPLSDEMGRIPAQVQVELGSREVGPVEGDRLIQAKARAELLAHPVAFAGLYLKGTGLMLVLPNTNFLANMLGILSQPTGLIADMRTRTLAENVRALTAFAARYLVGSPDELLFFAALLVEELVLWLTYALAVVGVVTGWRRSQLRPAIVLMLVITGYFFAVTGPIGTGRYRLPAMPFLALLGGLGAVGLLAWMQARRARKMDKSG